VNAARQGVVAREEPNEVVTTLRSDAASVAHEAGKHPPGLYVLFATEMWERFSFYSRLAMFTLYLRDGSGQGFGWSVERANPVVYICEL
jgi:dipeptide/tripeptide permease